MVLLLLNKTNFTLYLIILTLSPLLFGAVHTYAYTIMSLGVLTGTLLLVIQNVRKDPTSGAYQLQVPNTGLNFAFFILVAFLIFQMIPLPDPLLRFLSPEAMVVREKSLPASGALTESFISQWFALSPYYYPVRMSLIRFMIYGLFFLGLSQLLNSQKRIEFIIFLVLAVGCFEALYGLAQTYSGAGSIWWFKNIYYRLDVSGTYINRNHFAGLMEMCLLLAAAYAGALSARKKKPGIMPRRKTSLRSRLSRYLSGEQRFNKRTLILFAGAVMGIGLVFSASRGGMIATAGALLCMSLFFVFRKNHRRKGFIILFLFLITSIYALHIGVEYPLGRFKYFDESLEARSRYTQKTMDMFEDYPITGVGVGNFQYAYPRYQASEDKKMFFRHAHNDWAQFLAEAGIIGLCLLFAGILYYLYRTIRLWRKRSDPFAACLGVAPLAAMTAMAIHSYSDFNLHIPANFLMLSAIMAIGYSALHLERHGRVKILNRCHIMPLKYKGIFILLFVLGLIIWPGYWTIRHFMAEVLCNTVTNSTLNRDQNPPLEEIKKAIEWDRWNAQYWYKRARELMRVRNAETGNPEANDEDQRKRQMDIIRALEEAVQLNPFQAEYHLELSWAYVYLWKDPDYHKRWLPAADISMERAAYFGGERDPRLHVSMGNYWVWRSKTINPVNPDWESAWAKTCWHYKKAQSLERGKRLADKIVRYVWKYYPDKEFVSKALLTENQSLLDEMK